ncbi:hemerythrin domain-containing protein [Actinomycetospora rhizophila]|uniref:Hemerythrin domain-containing protein n=1 Tax=Actinomycetospora rhizophila TaxID=1416876 RepID=A0ABV9Z9F5_9PSEU
MTTATPTRQDDLLGITLGHRAMCADSRRLADLAARVVDGTERVDRTRAVAIARWVGRLADEILHHHEAEDDVLWPVLEARAGDRVDLAALTDDHAALDPLLVQVRAAADDLAQAPADAAAARALARHLGALADLLAEHIAEEEREVFPIILAHVPQHEWHGVEAAVRDRGGDMGFVLPRVAAVASPEQRAALRRVAGPVLTVLLPLTRRRLRRAERLVFGGASRL